MTTVRHTTYMTIRHLRELWRQPWFVAVTLVQPVIWLLLFGTLFKKGSRSRAFTPTARTSAFSSRAWSPCLRCSPPAGAEWR